MIHKCDECDFETENGKTMSNHKRWKHRKISFSEEGFKSLRSKKVERITKDCICEKCGKHFEKTLTESGWKRIKNNFCSRSCANTRTLSEETKKKISDSIKISEKFKIASINNRINKDRPLRVNEHKKCPICGKDFYSSHKTCSLSCGEKLRYSYTKSDKYKRYKFDCFFVFSLNDYPDEFDFDLIRQFGWYSPDTSKKPNKNGVSRDHMVSVMFGYKNNIDPKYIGHPANCKLLRQLDNVSKLDKCSITFDELLERIKVWEDKYGPYIRK